MENIYKDDPRYSEVKIASVTFLEKEERMERGVLWYNYFTGRTKKYDSIEFFSTMYEESTEGIILNEPLKIRYVIDYQVCLFALESQFQVHVELQKIPLVAKVIQNEVYTSS